MPYVLTTEVTGQSDEGEIRQNSRSEVRVKKIGIYWIRFHDVYQFTHMFDWLMNDSSQSAFVQFIRAAGIGNISLELMYKRVKLIIP